MFYRYTIRHISTVSGDLTVSNGIDTLLPGTILDTISIGTMDDNIHEGDESFQVTISDVRGARLNDGEGLGIIIDNDILPALSVHDSLVVEGDAGVSLGQMRISMSRPSASAVRVSYASADGTARISDLDYRGKTGTIVIPVGATTAYLTLEIQGDKIWEYDENMTVTLTAATGSSINGGTATLTITNDDSLPVLTLISAHVDEGDAGERDLLFRVQLDRPSSVPVTFSYISSDMSAVAGSDYKVVSGRDSVPAGSIHKTLRVPVFGDTDVEEKDSLKLTLTTSRKLVKGDTVLAAFGFINNDDITDSKNTFLNISDARGNEGMTLDFLVRLTQPRQGTDTVFYRYTTYQISTASGDLIVSNGIDTLLPGATLNTISIGTVDDNIHEGDESFQVILSDVRGARLNDGEGLGIIIDNDVIPSITVSDDSVDEGDAGQILFNFKIELNHPSSRTVRISYTTIDSTAEVSSMDYMGTRGVLQILALTTVAHINVKVNGDRLTENNEYFKLVLSNPISAIFNDSLAIGEIKNDDRLPNLSILDAIVDEGNTGIRGLLFKVTLDRPSVTNVTFEYATSDNTTNANADYISIPTTKDTIPAGETSLNIHTIVKGDVDIEDNETLNLTLSSLTNATSRKLVGIGTINNDDLPGDLEISVSSASASEGDSLKFAVNLEASSIDTVRFTYILLSETAQLNKDLPAASGIFEILPGKRLGTIRIATTEDNIYETDESFILTLSNPENGFLLNTSMKGIIVNDDALPKALIEDILVKEGNAGTTVHLTKVLLDRPSILETSIPYIFNDDIAQASDEDYQSSSGSAIFKPLDTIAYIGVRIKGDRRYEANERFIINLLPSKTISSFIDNSGTVIIVNDDSIPELTISDASIDERTGAVSILSFPVTLKGFSSNTIKVAYRVSALTATVSKDYIDVNDTLVFTSGETRKTITVTVVGDNIYEPTETLSVSLSKPAGSKNVNIVKGSAIGSIVDDDGKPFISAGSASAVEGDTLFFNLRLSNPSYQTIVVTYIPLDGTTSSAARLSNNDFESRGLQTAILKPGDVRFSYSYSNSRRSQF